jgi:hypothetical protein
LIADHLGIDLGAPPLGVLELLEHDDPGALAHHETVACLIPRARRPLRRIIESRREGPRSGKSGDAQPTDRGLGPAGDHDVRIVQSDQPRGIADRMSARRARRHDRVVRSLELIADGNVPRRQIDERRRYEERREAPRPLLVHSDRPVGDGLKAADTGADHHAGAFLAFLVGRLPTGVLDRLLGGRQGEHDEIVDPPPLLRRDVIVRIETARGDIAARHLTGNLRRQVRDVEALDRSDPGLALEETPPSRLDPASERCDQSQPGDDDASHDAMALGAKSDGEG